PGEADLIKVRCSLAGMSISDFLRSLALDQEINSTANPDELKKIRAELGKMGSNINHRARAVNSGEEFDEERLKKMADWLVQTIEQLLLPNLPPAAAFEAWPIISRARKKLSSKKPIIWRATGKIT